MPPSPLRVDELFAEALLQPAGEGRNAFLAQACAGDMELQLRVERLLRAHEQADQSGR